MNHKLIKINDQVEGLDPDEDAFYCVDCDEVIVQTRKQE